MTVASRLQVVEAGRQQGLKEGIDALGVELSIIRAAMEQIDPHLDESIRAGAIELLRRKAEVWIAAIQVLEALK